MVAHRFPLHSESSVVLNAPVEAAFSYLDDFRKLSSHMEQSSGMMMGSRMTIEMDERAGRVVGARVRMRGTVMGLRLDLEEVVTEREPPFRKAWETIEARLLVIGQYRLGFELSPQGDASKLRVFIDYSLPQKPPARWLGQLFSGAYARWCTNRMARDASRYFIARPAGTIR
jgi:uncharacterized membrane protein